MPMQTSYYKRKTKNIGAPGPLGLYGVDDKSTYKDGIVHEPTIMKVLNLALIACYISMWLLAVIFIDQVNNVDTAENRVGLGVRVEGGIDEMDIEDKDRRAAMASGEESVLHVGKGDGLITLRDGTTKQCDKNRVNAEWYHEQKEHFLRLRCVPSHLAANQSAASLYLATSWNGLKNLDYDPATSATALTVPASGASATTTPLRSCSGDLTCDAGFTCVLLHYEPTACDPSKHSRCMCSQPAGTVAEFVGETAEATAGAGKNNLCYSSTDADNLVDGNAASTVTTSKDADELCTGGAANRCIADDGQGWGGKVDATALDPVVARRLSRHRAKSKRVHTRTHYNDEFGVYETPPVDDPHRITNGQRLHMLLYGNDAMSRLEEGQQGPALILVIVSTMSTVMGLGTWIYVYVVNRRTRKVAVLTEQQEQEQKASASQDDTGAMTSEVTHNVFFRNKWQGVLMTILSNLFDFAIDICVLVLLQRARYNNDIDLPYGVSMAWSAAGCYDGVGGDMSKVPTNHKLDVDDNTEKVSAGDFGGDVNVVWGMFVVMCVRFVVHRVAGTSLYTAQLDI